MHFFAEPVGDLGSWAGFVPIDFELTIDYVATPLEELLELRQDGVKGLGLELKGGFGGDRTQTSSMVGLTGWFDGISDECEFHFLPLLALSLFGFVGLASQTEQSRDSSVKRFPHLRHFLHLGFFILVPSVGCGFPSSKSRVEVGLVFHFL
jgi:hypothetical protein